MGEEISHYHKRQHDILNSSNCSDFPDGNSFYFFGGKKMEIFFALFPRPNAVTSAQKTNDI